MFCPEQLERGRVRVGDNLFGAEEEGVVRSCNDSVLSFLSVPQFFLGPLAPGDIRVRAHHAQCAAVRGALNDGTLVENPHEVAVPVARPDLRLEFAACRIENDIIDQHVQSWHIVRVDQRVPHVDGGHGALRIEAEHREPAIVDLKLVCDGIPLPQPELAKAQLQIAVATHWNTMKTTVPLSPVFNPASSFDAALLKIT